MSTGREKGRGNKRARVITESRKRILTRKSSGGHQAKRRKEEET
jgi:hypothetical protein